MYIFNFFKIVIAYNNTLIITDPYIFIVVSIRAL